MRPSLRQLAAQNVMLGRARRDPTAVAALWRVCHPATIMLPQQWVTVFSVAGFTIDGHPADRPVESVTAWRGATAAGRNGMSWSTDRTHAQRFANHPGAQLWEAVIPAWGLLAQITAESEYVVHPLALMEGNVWPADRPAPDPLTLPDDPSRVLPPRDESALPPGLPRSAPLELHRLYAQGLAVLRKSGH